MTETPVSRAGRRRTAPRRGLNPLLLVAVLVPVLTALVALGLHQPQVATGMTPPVEAPLTRADRGCPATPDDRGEVMVASARPDVAGEVSLRVLDDDDAESESLAVPAGGTGEVSDPGAVRVTGRDQLAPGLMATRVVPGRLAAVACPGPSVDTWFSGLGGRAEHASVIELQNPDLGASVVDIEIYAHRGQLDVPELLGIRVPGRSAYVVDLAEAVPRRRDVAAHVVVSRGRLSATVRDRFAQIGGSRTEDWLPGQEQATTSQLLLGLPPGSGTRQLTLFNTSADQARVSLKLVSDKSTFSPSGAKEIQVRPQSLVQLRLTEVLDREVRRGTVGVLVEATSPVVATLSSRVDDDLAFAQAASATSGAASVVLPPGDRTVVIAGATTTGLATVTFRAANGRSLREERVELTSGRSFSVTVPGRAAVADIEIDRTTASAVVVAVDDRGSVVLPFTSPPEVGLVPSVRRADG
jgi:Family of unknown function (DUF5719)